MLVIINCILALIFFFVFVRSVAVPYFVSV